LQAGVQSGGAGSLVGLRGGPTATGGGGRVRSFASGSCLQRNGLGAFLRPPPGGQPRAAAACPTRDAQRQPRGAGRRASRLRRGWACACAMRVEPRWDGGGGFNATISRPLLHGCGLEAFLRPAFPSQPRAAAACPTHDAHRFPRGAGRLAARDTCEVFRGARQHAGAGSPTVLCGSRFWSAPLRISACCFLRPRIARISLMGLLCA
jgi:hypothetical protein